MKANSRKHLPAVILVVLGSLLTAKAQPPARQLVQPNAGNGKRIALVIGNGAYQNANPLKNPPNDAKAIADALREVGFEVTLGVNKPQREMKQMMREFGQRLRTQGGVGLFYYAGHGVQAKGHNYLIPVAAEIQSEADLEDGAVDVNYVLNLMDEAQNALNIVILDACRNNPFSRSFRSTQDGLAQVKAPTGTLIAYATAPDNVAADGGGANSPYTEELMKEIRTPGVLIETMFRRVAERVSSRTGGRQEPWFSANVKGDFYFSATAGEGANIVTTPTTTSPVSISEAAKEEALWEAVRDSHDPQDFRDYLSKYPNGAYQDAARIKLRRLEAPKAAPTTSQPPANTATDTSQDRGLGESCWRFVDSDGDSAIFHFFADGRFEFANQKNFRGNGTWSRSGNHVTLVYSDGHTKREGTINGSSMQGASVSSGGAHYTWTGSSVGCK